MTDKWATVCVGDICPSEGFECNAGANVSRQQNIPLTVLSGVQLILFQTEKHVLSRTLMWTYAGVALTLCFCDARCVFKRASNWILLYIRQRADQTPTHENQPLFSLVNAGWTEGREPRSALRWPPLGKSNFQSQECEQRKQQMNNDDADGRN